MMKIADAMPEAKFGYQSTPAQCTWGQQIMHAATTNVDLLKALGGKAPPPLPTHRPPFASHACLVCAWVGSSIIAMVRPRRLACCVGKA